MNAWVKNIQKKQLSSRFWCLLFFISLTYFSFERWHLANAIRDGFKFIVIDDTTFFYPRSLEFREANDLHYEQAFLACETLLNRHPGGIENEKRLKSLFHPQAYRKAMKMIEAELLEFQAKSIYQQVNIKETKLLQMSDQSVLVLVTGQLIRVGQFADDAFVEALDFELQCKFVLNRNMVNNGRYPTIVSNFELKTKPISAL